ncbi:LysR family transcriptional regulator [Vibrio kagoshimensis]|uniref:LysR family transcriptional regulator n=1 Tax=Vibrio kagoshimensis TaxID=2910244 RepID=UPI003D1AD5AE
MDLNSLKYFIAVYEEKGVSNAAIQLGVTPSAVSQNISKLNEYYNEVLFIRSGSHLVPTSKGVSLYESIKPHIEAITTESIALRNPRKSKRVISYFSHKDGDILFYPQLLEKISNSNFDVSLNNRANYVHKDDWVDELVLRKADFLISTHTVEHRGFENILLFEEELVAVCRKGHLKEKLMNDQSCFLEQDFIAWSTSKDQPFVLDSLYAGDIENRNIVYSSDSLLTTLYMVSKSELVCVVPKYHAQLLEQELKLSIFPLPFEESLSIPVYLSYRKIPKKDIVLNWVIKQIQEIVQNKSSII